ncbi:MAG TPA: hypothetical protein VGK74_03670 [Symbiobacteriaceae bacterium]|jgi:hypothetical protein
MGAQATVPLRLLPNSRDQATLAAFWRQLETQEAPTGILNGFPRSGPLVPCHLHPATDRPDATCQTQISAVDPRHDPTPPGNRQTEQLRTITLTAAWAEVNSPRRHAWSFVVDQQGLVAVQNESGDPLPL